MITEKNDTKRDGTDANANNETSIPNKVCYCIKRLRDFLLYGFERF